MNVGYVDDSDRFFCTSCWSAEANAGHRLAKVLDDEEEGPDDNFWIVDDCAKCRRRIKYKDVRLLT